MIHANIKQWLGSYLHCFTARKGLKEAFLSGPCLWRRSRRYRVTLKGFKLMTAAIFLREEYMPKYILA
jgi:hypothetical protein